MSRLAHWLEQAFQNNTKVMSAGLDLPSRKEQEDYFESLSPDIQEVAISIGKWRNCGRVIVTLDETLQALLACTPVGLLEYDDFTSPWGLHATNFTPPLEAKCMATSCSGVHMTDFVITGHASAGWGDERMAQACEKDRLITYNMGFTQDRVMSSNMRSVHELNDALEDPDRSRPLRVAIGLSRLIKSHTASRQDEPLIEIVDRGIIRPKGKKEGRGHRSIHIRRLFIVDQDIAEACRAAIRGGPRAPCLRHLVRGHWRNQACGPAHADRNLLWIQPHWRGAMRGVLRPVQVEVH